MSRLIVIVVMGCVLISAMPGLAQVSKPEPVDLSVLEKDFENARADYFDRLQNYLPAAYNQRFAALTDEQLAEIARTRRLWQYYTVHTSKTNEFQKNFLDPIDAVGEMLLIDPERIEDEQVKQARTEAIHTGQALIDAQRKAGIDIDPTKEMKSPTGRPYPALDQPHTVLDTLELYEHSLVLAHTVAPPAAEPVLMENARRCSLIDVEEARFVMYGNQVRMLIGTVAWVADPLTTACARDHSVDRKDGKASGHNSTVPGKETFGDRLKLWGAKGASEGAGAALGRSISVG
ncbi:MAG: hypothetical protein KTR15_07315 [Phycisphaeraceae bacterium]|nr:hypothetical protein [Phycisphaeraceae bacterium]